MDNLSERKVKGVRQTIAAVGAFAIYLPKYSPGVDPIELWWADLKRQLRRLGPRAPAELTQVAQ